MKRKVGDWTLERDWKKRDYTREDQDIYSLISDNDIEDAAKRAKKNFIRMKKAFLTNIKKSWDKAVINGFVDIKYFNDVARRWNKIVENFKKSVKDLENTKLQSKKGKVKD